jgi:hypothetical protein
VVPLLRVRASLDASSVEVREHRGRVDSEPVGEFLGGVARAVAIDKRVDVRWAQPTVRWVRRSGRGSDAGGSRSVLAAWLCRGV